jgi:hypothetical protein
VPCTNDADTSLEVLEIGLGELLTTLSSPFFSRRGFAEPGDTNCTDGERAELEPNPASCTRGRLEEASILPLDSLRSTHINQIGW